MPSAVATASAAAPPTRPIPIPGADVAWYVARALSSYRRHVTDLGCTPAEAYAIVVAARATFEDDAVVLAVVRAVSDLHAQTINAESAGWSVRRP